MSDISVRAHALDHASREWEDHGHTMAAIRRGTDGLALGADTFSFCGHDAQAAYEALRMHVAEMGKGAQAEFEGLANALMTVKKDFMANEERAAQEYSNVWNAKAGR